MIPTKSISIVHLVLRMGLGGMEVSTAKLATDQKRRGCDVTVVCLFGAGCIGEKLQSEGIEVIDLKLQRGLGMMNLIFPLWRICTRWKVDILQVHTVGVEIPVWIVAVLSGIRRRILTIRAFVHYSGWRYWRAKLGAKVTNLCFDKIVCVSNALKDHEIRYLGRKASEIIVIWNGIDTVKFSPRPLEPSSRAGALGLDSVKPDAFVVGMGIQLERFKDIPTLMRAAVRVKEQSGSKVLFVVAGTGSLEMELKTLAEQLETDDCFKFVGRIDDMPSFLNAIDLLALVSPFEGLPGIVSEAMATGKPVVTTDSGGIRDSVTDGQTGFIVPVSDDVSLANAILRLADDRDLAERMGQAGLKRARRDFTLEKYTQSYWDLLTNADA